METATKKQSVNRNAKTITLAATTLCTACAISPSWSTTEQGRAKQTQQASPQKQVKQPAAQVQILRANVDRTGENGKPKNTLTILGKSGIRVKKANVVMENADDPNFTVDLTTDKFSQNESDHLVIKVKDKVFVPYGCGGDQDSLWSLSLRDVDKASAELLCGGVLQEAPKESITVEYKPWKESYPVHSPVDVLLISNNVGKTPLS